MQRGNAKRKAGLVICLLIMAHTSWGQVKNDKKLTAIPSALRQRFVERRNLYFELKQTKQYGEINSSWTGAPPVPLRRGHSIGG